MDTIWLAEAYPWWRKHGMEARSSTVVSALMARETKRLTIGWGIISPFTRHPVQVAMDARVVQEAAGPGRFILGFGTSKIFLNNAQMQTNEDARPDARRGDDRARRARRRAVRYDGSTVERRRAGAAGGRAHAARRAAGLRRGDGAEDAAARRRDRRRLPHTVDHDARVRPLHMRERERRHRHRLHGRRLDPRDRPRRGPRRRARDRRHVPRQQGAEHPGRGRHAARPRAAIEQDEIRPVAEAMEQGGRLAAKAKVSDALLDKCKPIAGTPADCIAAIEEYSDAGCTHVMLELWGEDRHEQIRLFGEQVLPHRRGDPEGAGRGSRPASCGCRRRRRRHPAG